MPTLSSWSDRVEGRVGGTGGGEDKWQGGSCGGLADKHTFISSATSVVWLVTRVRCDWSLTAVG